LDENKPLIPEAKSIKERKGMKREMRYILSLAAAGLVVVSMSLFALATSVTSDDTIQASAEVKIDNFSFGPQTLTVAAGTEVVWVNRDDIPHTIVSVDGIFKSKARDTDERFSYKFTKPGRYSYYCSLHPKMTGTIVVR
jgi:plastocyanin